MDPQQNMERYAFQEREKIVRTFCQRNSPMMATLHELSQAIDIVVLAISSDYIDRLI